MKKHKEAPPQTSLVTTRKEAINLWVGAHISTLNSQLMWLLKCLLELFVDSEIMYWTGIAKSTGFHFYLIGRIRKVKSGEDMNVEADLATCLWFYVFA